MALDKAELLCMGAGQEVGRSSFLLDIGEKVLMDYGVKLTSDQPLYPMHVKTNLDAVIISHAHLDHAGHLPTLFVDSRFMSYMTPPTLELSRLLWLDTIKIASQEGGHLYFSKEDVSRAESYCFQTTYRRQLHITKDVSLEFFDAGHIPGSAITRLNFHKRSLVYTGDFNLSESRLFSGADLSFGETDFLLTESTYGDRDHPPRKKVEKEFSKKVEEIVEQGGWAIVPAFAVERCQQLIDILYQYKPNAPVYLDGLGQKASMIFLNFPQYFKNPDFLEKALHATVWVKSPRMRKNFFKEPGVVVTTAGMLQGGPVYQYLPKIINDKKSGILLTGFQVQGTPGRKLLDEGKIYLGNEELKAKCFVHKYDFSAHASRHNLHKMVKYCNPQKVVCVHGDPKITEIFKEDIRAMGCEAFNPKVGDKVKLV